MGVWKVLRVDTISRDLPLKKAALIPPPLAGLVWDGINLAPPRTLTPSLPKLPPPLQADVDSDLPSRPPRQHHTIVLPNSQLAKACVSRKLSF